MWELWTVIKDTPLQTRPNEYPAEYVVINDYTVDVDRKSDVLNINKILGGIDMLKVEVIEPFTLGKFKELQNIVRASVDTPGQLNVGDTFECTEEMGDYLMKTNAKGRAFVKVLEVIPAKNTIKTETKTIKEVKKAPKKIVSSKPKTTKKTKSKKEIV